jgi:hypothetical protein
MRQSHLDLEDQRVLVGRYRQGCVAVSPAPNGAAILPGSELPFGRYRAIDRILRVYHHGQCREQVLTVKT